MSEPQTPSERTAWLRERAKHHGVSVQDCAQYIAELRKQYREIAGPGGRVVTALGFGLLAVSAFDYRIDLVEQERIRDRRQLAVRIANGDLNADNPMRRCRCIDNPPGALAICPLAEANNPSEEGEYLSCRCCDGCRALCAEDAEDVDG